jgi:serine-type D-Ala-D-Ala carboxypeptidase/endopeptidase (penicillin-binding protein 4)
MELMVQKYWLVSSSLVMATMALPPAVLAQSAAPPESSQVCAADLDKTVAAIADRRGLQRYQWGIYAQALNANLPLLNYRGQSNLIPASTTKLLTTAAVLRQFGGQYRLRTSVYRDPGGDPLQPSLTVVGRGDPTITTTEIQKISTSLKAQGIQRIAQLTADTSYFRGDSINSDWEWGDLVTDYGTPVTSLILQQNAVSLAVTPQKAGQPAGYRWRNALAGIPWQIDNRSITGPNNSANTIGLNGSFGRSALTLNGRIPANGSATILSLAMLDPQDTWLRQLQFSLGQQQIPVNRLQWTDRPILGNEIAAIDSPPLIDLIKEINRNSNNLFAEVMLRTIGRANPKHSSSDMTTADLGLEMVQQKLREIGVDPIYYQQYDGSGLSRKNLIAPIVLVQTLVGMARTPEANLFRDSLASSGQSGTLTNRFKSMPGKIRGKTGSFTGTSALAGYAEPTGYQPLAFSITVNNFDRPSAEIRGAIDEIVGTLLKLKSC